MQKHPTVPLSNIADDPKDKLAVKPFEQENMLLHDHDCFELAYVTGGSAEHILNDTATMVSTGDYFFIDYGSCHGYQKCCSFRLINCLFLAETVDGTLSGHHSFDDLLRVCLIRYHRQYFGKTPANRIFHDQDGRILQLLLGMQKEYEQKKTGYQEIFRGRLLEILILTMRQVVLAQSMQEQNLEKFRQDRGSDIVLEAVRYLKANYTEHAVLGRFCQEYHYSLPYVSRRFRQETGLSALEYLQKIRIEKSCELLLGNDLPVQEIARMAGYENVKFFNQIFRRMLGVSPGEYRKTASSLAASLPAPK